MFFLAYYLFVFSNFSYGQTYPVYKKPSAIAVLDQDALFSSLNGVKVF